VRACNTAGCSGYGSTKTVRVTLLLPPPVPGAITGPASSSTGSYTLNWGASARASRYQLQERVGSGAWTNAYSGASRSKALSGKSSGTYSYRVRACNSAGCSAYGAARAVTVVRAPSGRITLPPTSTGDYTVAFSRPHLGSRYNLKESTDGGRTWDSYTLGTALSKSFTDRPAGAYTYDVEYCTTTGPASQLMCHSAHDQLDWEYGVIVVTPAAPLSPPGCRNTP